MKNMSLSGHFLWFMMSLYICAKTLSLSCSLRMDEFEISSKGSGDESEMTLIISEKSYAAEIWMFVKCVWEELGNWDEEQEFRSSDVIGKISEEVIKSGLLLRSWESGKGVCEKKSANPALCQFSE